jgi:hypothetical protein
MAKTHITVDLTDIIADYRAKVESRVVRMVDLGASRERIEKAYRDAWRDAKRFGERDPGTFLDCLDREVETIRLSMLAAKGLHR